MIYGRHYTSALVPRDFSMTNSLVVRYTPLVYADETPQRYLEKPAKNDLDRKLTKLSYT